MSNREILVLGFWIMFFMVCGLSEIVTGLSVYIILSALGIL